MPVERRNDAARASAGIAQGVEQIQEAALRKMVRSELLYAAATQQPEVDCDLQEPGSDTRQRCVTPFVLRRASPLANATKVVVQLLGANAKRARLVRREQPPLEEVAKEKLVSRHMHEQDWLPIFHGAAAFS